MGQQRRCWAEEGNREFHDERLAARLTSPAAIPVSLNGAIMRVLLGKRLQQRSVGQHHWSIFCYPTQLRRSDDNG